jgi:hypothetical protein
MALLIPRWPNLILSDRLTEVFPLPAVLISDFSTGSATWAASPANPQTDPHLLLPRRRNLRPASVNGQHDQETLEKVYGNLDFTHALRAFSDTLQAVSIHAVRKGIASVEANMAPRDRSGYYHEDANRQNMLFATGFEFETPIPMITKEGVKPFPTTG